MTSTDPRCPQCSASLFAGSRFCTACGAVQAAVVPSQATVMPPAPHEMAATATHYAPVPNISILPGQSAEDLSRFSRVAPIPTHPSTYHHQAPPGWATPPPQGWPPPPGYVPGQGQDSISRLGEQLRDLPLSTLVPLRAWVSDRGWLGSWVGLFALFAFAPFVLLQATKNDEDIHRIAWGFAIYFAVAWCAALHVLIKPERQRLGLIAGVVAFTTVAGVAIAIALEKAIQPDDTSLVQMVFGVGLPEEFAKALAVYLFVFRSQRQLWSTRAFLFVGCVSGLAFGAAEAVTYSSLYQSAAPYLSASSYTVEEVWRLLTDSLFHACMAGISAYFIGLAHWHRTQAVILMTSGLALAALLHGAYDRWAGGWGGTAVALLIIVIFTGYVRSGDAIAHEYSITEGAL